jgi:hypothetical protein
MFLNDTRSGERKQLPKVERSLSTSCPEVSYQIRMSKQQNME